jgi:RNA polymerase subunit RPABC4/transcription elongation factor Spt4
MSDVHTCEECGVVYFLNSQSEQCPHDNNSTFTRAMIEEVRKRLRGNVE